MNANVILCLAHINDEGQVKQGRQTGADLQRRNVLLKEHIPPGARRRTQVPRAGGRGGPSSARGNVFLQ